MKFSDVPTSKPAPRTGKPEPGSDFGHPSSLSTYSIPIVEASGDYQEPLIVLLYGDPGSGKSRMIGTAPGDIGVLPMEHKSRQSILRAAAEFGKRVFMPEIDLIRSSRAMMIATMPEACVSPDSFKNMRPEDAVKAAEAVMQRKAKAIPLDGEPPECCQRCHHRWHANRTKSVAFRMAEMPNIKTIGIDPFGTLIDDMLFANYGRNEKIMPLDRKSFNREVVDFLNALSHKNLVLCHHSATIWKDNKPTNKSKPMSSFSKIGHYTSVVAHLKRDDDKGEGEGRYTLTVDDCQANASIIGMDLLQDDGITFQAMAEFVYPDSVGTNAWM